MAEAIASIRRPAWTDWALNQTATEHPDPVTAFTAAAGAMRDAQAAAVEGRATDLARALRTLRDSVSTLAKQANSSLTRAGRSGELADLVERLGAIAADEHACEQLRGAVLRADDGSTDDVLAGLPAATSSAPSTSRTTTRQPHEPAPRRRSKQPADGNAHAAEHQRAAEAAAEQAAERRRLMRELADAERAQRTSSHELTRVDRSLGEAVAKHEAATAALERADRELAAATERRDDLSTRRDAVAKEIAAAERAAERLRQRLAAIASEQSDR